MPHATEMRRVDCSWQHLQADRLCCHSVGHGGDVIRGVSNPPTCFIAAQQNLNYPSCHGITNMSVTLHVMAVVTLPLHMQCIGPIPRHSKIPNAKQSNQQQEHHHSGVCCNSPMPSVSSNNRGLQLVYLRLPPKQGRNQTTITARWPR